MKIIRSAILAAALAGLAAAQASAVTVRYSFDPNLKRVVTIVTGGQSETGEVEVSLEGEFEIDDEDFGRFGPGKTGFFPVDSFDIDLNYVIDRGGAAPISATVPVNPSTASLVLNQAAVRVDEDRVVIDAGGIPFGTPLYDITVGKFVDAGGNPVEHGFPDGRRFGDDVDDLLLIQLFAGSVNLGFAALTEGFRAPPSIVSQAELTPGDVFQVASSGGAAAAVPLPAGALTLLGALGLLGWTSRRRRA